MAYGLLPVLVINPQWALPAKEITLDLLANTATDQGLFHAVVGFHHLHNLYFL